jgi:polar amino acid transport system substrate-binding protein
MACTRRIVLAASLLAGVRATAQTGRGTIVLGTDQTETSYHGRWIRRTYVEAFRRLELPLKLVHVPTQRAAAMLAQGEIDGEVARARAYAAANPSAIRVDEAILEARFVLYGADPALQLQRVEDLQARPLRVAYRRGVVFCERTLQALQLPPERLTDVTDTAQGLNMVVAGRADVFCDIDAAAAPVFAAGSIKGAAAIRRVLELDSADNYPYLHGRHAALAPRLAATLKQMKAEGLLDRYREDAQREVEGK